MPDARIYLIYILFGASSFSWLWSIPFDFISGKNPSWTGPPIVEQVSEEKNYFFVKIITVSDDFCTAEHDLSDNFMGRPSGNV